jgi:hypothetical protein
MYFYEFIFIKTIFIVKGKKEINRELAIARLCASTRGNSTQRRRGTKDTEIKKNKYKEK